jgi:hypothetical protein
MSTYGKEKTTGAFRFDSQWHLHEGPLWGTGSPGKPFDSFKTCSVCGGNIRYCGIVQSSWGLANMSVSPETQRLEWEKDRQRFADISTRCSCDRDGDRAYAVEYDRRPFSISFDGSFQVPGSKSNLSNFLESKLSQLIDKLEQLRKRIK